VALATHTLRDYVRQRANLVRLSGQHIQRMQKALELMNLKLTARGAGGAVEGRAGAVARVAVGEMVGMAGAAMARAAGPRGRCAPR
jgi:hypothetical protein